MQLINHKDEATGKLVLEVNNKTGQKKLLTRTKTYGLEKGVCSTDCSYFIVDMINMSEEDLREHKGPALVEPKDKSEVYVLDLEHTENPYLFWKFVLPDAYYYKLV